MSLSAEEAFRIEASRGWLRGMRHHPVSPETGRSVVLLQGYFSSTHVGPARLYVQMARILAELGLEVLRVDPWGVGDSDGDFADTSWESELEDYRAVLAWDGLEGRERVLLGHSIGAGLAVRIASEERGLGRMLLVSPTLGPLSPPGRSLLDPAQVEALALAGRTEKAGTVVTAAFMEAIHHPRVFEDASRVGQETMILWGTEDEFYDRAGIDRLLRALPRSRVQEIPGGDHNFLRPGVRPRFLSCFRELVRDWWGEGSAR